MDQGFYHRWNDIHKYTAPFKWVGVTWEKNDSDKGLREQYESINQLPVESLINPTFKDKFDHTMFLDVGPGNIKLRTAVGLLDKYNAQYNGADDFLGLNQYQGNLPQFVTDLNDPSHDLTAKLSGMLAQEATQFYQQYMTPTAWNYLTGDQKAAAVAQYYVRGPEKLAQKAAGQQFWFPDFSKPGSSFYNYKDNADVLRAALGYNTYPQESEEPQTETASIETSQNGPYNYATMPSPPATGNDAPDAYASQGQAAPAIGNALIPALRIGNALIGQTPAGAAANTLDPATLATMVLNRTFGLPFGTGIPPQSPAQQ